MLASIRNNSQAAATASEDSEGRAGGKTVLDAFSLQRPFFPSTEQGFFFFENKLAFMTEKSFTEGVQR
jgi:hypothetical protein